MIFKKIIYTCEFRKDLKRLQKRFRTLSADLGTFIKTQLLLFHKIKFNNDGIKLLRESLPEYPPVYKAKKFACRSIKGKGANTKIRVIYAYLEPEDKIELIEMYYKGDKKNLNKKRLRSYLKKKGGRKRGHETIEGEKHGRKV